MTHIQQNWFATGNGYRDMVRVDTWFAVHDKDLIQQDKVSSVTVTYSKNVTPI